MLPGTDPKQIGAHMQVELQQWLLSPIAQLQPGERDVVPKQTLRLSPGGAGVQALRDEYLSSLHLLMWISALVLAIACANVANLMLVRASTRKLQTSIRAALGASAGRQVRQVLNESVVLALLGGVVGVAIAFGATRLILHLAFQNTYVAIHASPSLPVLAFTFAVSLITGILFGVAPAWITANAAPADALRGAGRSTGRSGGWTQKSLVIAQAALSLVLLSAAGLLTQSLHNMQSQNFGFETPNRYILHIDPQMAGYKPAQMQSLFRQLHDSLAAIPGIGQVSFSLYTPMEGDNWGETVYIEGQAPPPPDSNQNNASWLRVSAGYFETLGTKIVQGRSISEQDSPTSQRVAVVNQTFAKHFFKEDNPIGKHFGYIDQKNAGDFEIVGVTEDTQYREPTRKIPPMFFLPSTQSVTFDNPRFIAFEDRSHELNAVELRTLGQGDGSGSAGAPRACRSEPGSRGHRLHEFRGASGQQLFPAGVDREPYFNVRIAGASPRVRGTLRSDGLFRGAPHERNWSSHGSRRRPVQHFEAGPARSAGADGNRTGDRHSCDDCGRPRYGYTTVWHKAVRSAHPAGGLGRAHLHRAPGGSGSGSTSSNARSDSSFAHGMKSTTVASSAARWVTHDLRSNRRSEIGAKSLDCITMSAPSTRARYCCLAREDGAGTRFARGTARYRTWRELERRALERASRSSREGVRKTDHGLKFTIGEMYGSD